MHSKRPSRRSNPSRWDGRHQRYNLRHSLPLTGNPLETERARLRNGESNGKNRHSYCRLRGSPDSGIDHQKLIAADFEQKKLSVAGKRYYIDERVTGFYNTGDRAKFWGVRGASWGSLPAPATIATPASKRPKSFHFTRHPRAFAGAEILRFGVPSKASPNVVDLIEDVTIRQVDQ